MQNIHDFPPVVAEQSKSSTEVNIGPVCKLKCTLFYALKKICDSNSNYNNGKQQTAGFAGVVSNTLKDRHLNEQSLKTIKVYVLAK